MEAWLDLIAFYQRVGGVSIMFLFFKILVLKTILLKHEVALKHFNTASRLNTAAFLRIFDGLTAWYVLSIHHIIRLHFTVTICDVMHLLMVLLQLLLLIIIIRRKIRRIPCNISMRNTLSLFSAKIIISLVSFFLQVCYSFMSLFNKRVTGLQIDLWPYYKLIVELKHLQQKA